MNKSPFVSSHVSPTYSCYISSPDKGAALTSSRYVSSRSNAGSNYNIIGQPIEVSPPQEGVKEVMTGQTGSSAMGVYACTASYEDGRQTVIPTFFMLENGNFYFTFNDSLIEHIHAVKIYAHCIFMCFNLINTSIYDYMEITKRVK